MKTDREFCQRSVRDFERIIAVFDQNSGNRLDESNARQQTESIARTYTDNPESATAMKFIQELISPGGTATRG
ncbi:hypothetical protein AB0M12_14175 [Nocardia vinacea]|uniref:hypothetical protein n=1 Tax=Nocardia vinacea TaxID=96468 RepID=UPI00343E7FC0